MRRSCLSFLAFLLLWLPAAARDAVIDGANILDARSKQQVQRIAADIEQMTGKELLVVTVDKVQGTAPQHAQQIFREQSLNGVLIYVAPHSHELGILPGNKTAQLFPRSVTGPIRQSMLEKFRQNDYSGGVVEGVQRVRSVFADAPSADRGVSRTAVPAEERHDSSFSWLPVVLLFGGILLAFSWLRRRRVSRSYGGGYRRPYPAGAGYPIAGGQGGGFFSGVLGGLGGAMLGNAIYDHFRPHAGAGPAVDPGPSWGDSDSGLAAGGDFGAADFGGGDFGGGGDDW